jgi:hypothetical protein
MEAKEFMLNDLVYRKEHFEFHKPVQRSVVKIDGVMSNDMITFAPNSEFLTMDEIEPIPFAEEIFEKNEFERNSFNGTIIFSKKSCVDIDWYDVIVEIGKDAEGIQRWDCVCIKIQKAGANLTLNNQSCFHELQHALCLVGLNEVADNLKVE